MTGPRITDTQLPLVSDLIDAVCAAAVGDMRAAAELPERLTPEQAGHAISLLVGMAGGCINQLIAVTGIEREVLIQRMRQQAAA